MSTCTSPADWPTKVKEIRDGHADFIQKCLAARKKPLMLQLIERIYERFARPGEMWRDLCSRFSLSESLGSYEFEKRENKYQLPKLPEISLELLVRTSERLNVTLDWLVFGKEPDERLVACIDALREDPDADVNHILGINLDPKPKLSDHPNYNPFTHKKLLLRERREVKAQAENSESVAEVSTV